MQVCTSLRTADNHASTPPLSFLPAGCPSCRPTNSVRALKAHYAVPNPTNSLCTAVNVSASGGLRTLDPLTKSWRRHLLILQLYIGAGGRATLAARVETRDLTLSVVHVASKQATNCVRGSDLIALHANVSPCVPLCRVDSLQPSSTADVISKTGVCSCTHGFSSSPTEMRQLPPSLAAWRSG